METANNQVQIYNNAIETFRSGGEVLVSNQLTVSKAVAAGNSIIAKIEGNAGKLDSDLDALCNNYLALVSKRKKELEEARKPITAIMDEVKKMFTGEEAKLDVKNSATVPFLIQSHRNAYAKFVAEEERKQREAAAKEAERGRERVQLLATVESQLNNFFNSYLFDFKQKLQQSFNSITLQNFEEKEQRIIALTVSYPFEHYASFTAQIRSAYFNDAEINQIASEGKNDKFQSFQTRFATEVEELKRQLIDRLPSKKAELEAMASAAAEDLKRMENEKAEREKAEAARLAREASEAEKKAQEEVELKKSAGETEVLFNQAAAIPAADAPEMRQGYELRVLHPAGYVQIFQYWFEREGMNLPIEKIGNTKMDQMKAFCEKHAHKKGEKIDSTHLAYEPTYKAVNRKAQ